MHIACANKQCLHSPFAYIYRTSECKECRMRLRERSVIETWPKQTQIWDPNSSFKPYVSIQPKRGSRHRRLHKSSSDKCKKHVTKGTAVSSKQCLRKKVIDLQWVQCLLLSFAAILPAFIYSSLETPPKNTMLIPDGKRALEWSSGNKPNTTCPNLIYERTNKGMCLEESCSILWRHNFLNAEEMTGLPASINSNKQAMFFIETQHSWIT